MQNQLALEASSSVLLPPFIISDSEAVVAGPLSPWNPCQEDIPIFRNVAPFILYVGLADRMGVVNI